MEIIALLTVALTILGFGAISRRLERTVVTPPMVFVAAGLLIGPLALGVVRFGLDAPAVHVLAEVTLVLILFTDASRIDLSLLRREHDLPVRLLAFGMPLTILLGAVFALLLFDRFSLWEGAVLAAILAPTDAALGLAVINNERVPVRIRQALNVESGLNDGIALPIFLIFVSLAGTAAGEVGSAAYWARFAALQLILGPAVGAVVGYLGGRLVHGSARIGWMNRSFQELSALGLALLAFAGAELIGGNGFIAAFVAGLALGNTSRSICTCLYEFGEAEGQLLALLVFLAFGAVLVPEAVGFLGLGVLAYAGLSLTVVRIVPTAIALLGARVQPDTSLFLGWFGPRGIASIVFALLVVEDAEIPGRELIFAVAATTVLLSVFAHGLTAYPSATWYANKADRMRRLGPEMPELMPVGEMPVRVPYAREG